MTKLLFFKLRPFVWRAVSHLFARGCLFVGRHDGGIGARRGFGSRSGGAVLGGSGRKHCVRSGLKKSRAQIDEFGTYIVEVDDLSVWRYILFGVEDGQNFDRPGATNDFVVDGFWKAFSQELAETASESLEHTVKAIVDCHDFRDVGKFDILLAAIDIGGDRVVREEADRVDISDSDSVEPQFQSGRSRESEEGEGWVYDLEIESFCPSRDRKFRERVYEEICEKALGDTEEFGEGCGWNEEESGGGVEVHGFLQGSGSGAGQ